MIRSTSSIAAMAVSFVAVASAQSVRPADIETALSVTGWDVVHVAEGADGAVVIGARNQQGWPVIHTLTSCEAGSCAVWSQSVPLEAGLLDVPVKMSSLQTGAINSLGSTLIAENGVNGAVVLRGSIVGRVCDDACQREAIDSFANASRVSYRSLSVPAAAASAHTGFVGWTDEREAAVAVPMDHRQIAAIVSATEDEADRLEARFTVPTPERTWLVTTTKSTEAISFPPLLPE